MPALLDLFCEDSEEDEVPDEGEAVVEDMLRKTRHSEESFEARKTGDGLLCVFFGVGPGFRAAIIVEVRDLRKRIQKSNSRKFTRMAVPLTLFVRVGVVRHYEINKFRIAK